MGVAPAASAGHVAVGIGIGLPGIAIVAPAPFAGVPPYFYGAAYYGPAFAAGPPYGYRYYGHPYYRYAPRGYVHGYRGGWYPHH
jgi:hypothetical protein